MENIKAGDYVVWTSQNQLVKVSRKYQTNKGLCLWIESEHVEGEVDYDMVNGSIQTLYPIGKKLALNVEGIYGRREFVITANTRHNITVTPNCADSEELGLQLFIITGDELVSNRYNIKFV